MLSTFGTGAEAIPYKATLSSAYAANEITPAEYNAALRVAELEDSVKRPFCKAHWSDVRVGDTVLVAEHELAIREARVVEVRSYTVAGRHCFKVTLNPEYSPRQYESGCWPDAIVYVQQR